MVGETNVAGARLRAVIAVTYPEGNICTCSNGTKTLKARDTSGKALFNVSTGTWTVTVTDGGRTISKSVSITSEGQYESVKLMYNVYLYNDGDQCTDITGGWEKYTYAGSYGGSSASVTKNTNNVVIAASLGSMPGSAHASAYLYTIGPVNLKYFKEIRTTVSQYSRGSAYIAVRSEPPSSPSSTVIASAGISGTGTKSLMIENIESGYVAVGMDTGAFAEGQSGSMTITKIECVG